MAIKIMDSRSDPRPCGGKERPTIGGARSAIRRSGITFLDPAIPTVAVHDAAVVNSVPADAIVQLAAIRASVDNRPMKKVKTESSGTGFGIVLGAGIIVFAATAFFARTALSRAIFGNLGHHNSTAAVQLHTIADHISTPPRIAAPASVVAPAAPKIRKYQGRDPNISSGAAAGHSEQPPAVNPLNVGGHPAASIKSLPKARRAKAAGPHTGHTLTHRQDSSHFDANNPPGALFTHTPNR